MLHACYLLFILCLCMSVKSSTELMLYVVFTMPTLNKAYLFIYYYGLRPLINDLTFNLHTMYSATIVDLIIVACSFNCWGSSWSSSYGSWIYDYLCNLSNHHYRCEFESRSGEVYSMQHYVIKFVSDLRQVCGLLRFLQPIKLMRRYS